MTTYDQMFGGLHDQTLAPKKTLGRPPGDSGGKPATKAPPRHAVPAKNPPQRPVANPNAAAPPPPPGSLGIPDLPPEIEAIVAQILAADPENGAARALAYIRGTDWYKQAYFGIAGGIKSGVISNEADYRAYVSQVKEAFARYYGRDPSQGELAGFLSQGYTPGTVEQIGGGHAWATANKGDTEYLFGAFDKGQLTDPELELLGQQQVGRNSAAGTGLQNRLNAAAAKMQRIFEGTIASPNFQLGGAGLSAPSLQPNQKPDVSA